MDFDLTKLMEQAQRLSRELEGRRAELARKEIEGQAAAGLVTAVMNGAGELLRVRIDPATFRGDQTLVEDLVVAAINSALGEVRNLQQRELSGLAGSPAIFGSIPGGMVDK